MLAALKEIHPQIGAALETQVNAAGGDAAKARVLFKGMFERGEGNIQKGRFAQALAAKIEDDGLEVVVPDYITAAVKHVSQK